MMAYMVYNKDIIQFEDIGDEKMDSVKIEIEIPKEILNYVDYSDKDYHKKVRQILFYQLVKEEKVSFGKSAEILGISKMEYIADLGKMGISHLNESNNEVKRDVETLEKHI